MKQLKDYITESKLTPEAKALSTMLKSVNYNELTPDVFNRIKSEFVEVGPNEKLGKTNLFINNETFEILAVGLSQGVWRFAEEKDLWKYPLKSVEKDFNKEFEMDYGQSGPAIYNKYYLYRSFKKVNDGVPSKGWKRAFIDIFGRNTPGRLVLINFDKKQWKYDISYNGNIKDLFWAGDAVNNSEFSKKHPLSIDYYSAIMNTCDPGENDGSKNWIEVKFDNKGTLYINLHTLEYSNSKYASQSDIEDQLNDLKNSKWPNSPISVELNDYILKNFKSVDRNDTDGKWIKVYKSGNDSKYGSYMINIERKLRRNTSFDEFYGGGFVD